MREYLTQLRDFFDKDCPPHIRTQHALLLDHGRDFAIGPDTYKGKRGRRHGCYMNAGKAALFNADLVYVEGKVSVYGVPIDHAWNVVRSTGELLDPTLRATKDNARSDYFGIPFKTKYLERTLLKTRVWGLIGYHNHELFNAGFPADEFVEKLPC